MEDAPMKDEAAVADSNSPPTVRQNMSHRTKALIVLLGVVGAAVLVGVLVHSRRSRAAASFYPPPSCNDYQRHDDWAPYPQVDKDPFDFSVVLYSVGTLYSYKHRNTNEAKGPKMLVMLNLGQSHSTSYEATGVTTAYRFGTKVHSGNLSYSFTLTIGKDADDGSTVWAGLDDKTDANVTIDPSVVHLRFGNNVIYNVYNDTVFLVSYASTNNTLQVEQRGIDLSNVTSECGVKQLLGEHVELSTFYSQYDKWLVYGECTCNLTSSR
jgi:hypothetical protein